MYYGELVTDMAQKSSGLRSIEHLWLLLAVITIYSREIVATTRSRGHVVTKFWLKRNFMGFWAILFLRMKRPEYYFRYQIWPHHSIRHAENLYACEIVTEKCCFKGTLRHVCPAQAQKGQNTTSGFKSDHVIRLGMVENLCLWKFGSNTLHSIAMLEK